MFRIGKLSPLNKAIIITLSLVALCLGLKWDSGWGIFSLGVAFFGFYFALRWNSLLRPFKASPR